MLTSAHKMARMEISTAEPIVKSGIFPSGKPSGLTPNEVAIAWAIGEEITHGTRAA